MALLIQRDPALANTVPLAVRRALPAEVQALLEDRIDALGDYLTAGVSFAPGQGPGTDPVVSTQVRLADGRKFRASSGFVIFQRARSDISEVAAVINLWAWTRL